MVETLNAAVEDNPDLDPYYRERGRQQLIERDRAETRDAGIPPEFRVPAGERVPSAPTPRPPRQSRISDPTIAAAVEQLPESMRAGAEAQYDLLQRMQRDGTGGATAQRDLALARGEREAREGYAATHRQELARMRERYVQTPDFVPTQENALSIGTLFGLLGVTAAMTGTAGKRSAVGAMNAMSGMLQGWRQGRSDLYNRERQNFDVEMRKVQAQNQALEREFKDALDLAKTDMDTGIARAREVAARYGVSIAGAAASRQGMQGMLSFLQSLQNTNMQLERYRSQVGNQSPIVVPRPQADGTVRYYYAQRDGSFLMQNGQPVEAPPPRAAGGGAGAGGPSATETRQRRDVRGQLRYLSEFLPAEEVENLGTREVPAVTTRMESAELSSRLAEEVRRNPQAAGLAARLIRRLEVLDPTRYGGNEQNSTFGGLVASLFGSSIDNATLEGPAEAVTKARQIAKLAVDVINARALAASGGSRMLVTELNMQKGVIGLEGLTPESAPAVYQRLADDDIAAMRRFGISYDRLSEIKDKLNEKAREYVRSGGLMPPERQARAGAAAPSGVTPSQDAIRYLRANLSETTKRQFDEVYGEGAADRVLRAQ